MQDNRNAHKQTAPSFIKWLSGEMTSALLCSVVKESSSDVTNKKMSKHDNQWAQAAR